MHRTALRAAADALRSEYPESAATSKQEGWVRVEFTISWDGSVLSPHVVDSSPDDTFDAVSLDAISKCRFERRIVNGMPVEIESAIFDFVFEL